MTQKHNIFKVRNTSDLLSSCIFYDIKLFLRREIFNTASMFIAHIFLSHKKDFNASWEI